MPIANDGIWLEFETGDYEAKNKSLLDATIFTMSVNT
jgi:hypothetical protein